MSAPFIRPATAGDLDAVLKLASSWPGLAPWSRAQFAAELDLPSAVLCVAEAEGIAGFAASRLLPPEAEVTLVAVRPDRLGRGVGLGLMRRLHERAAAEGCRECRLEVDAGNSPAIGLYGRLGYRVVGRRPKYYNGRSDALLMTCPLEMR